MPRRRPRAALAVLVVSVSVGGTVVAATLALAAGVVTMARKVVTPARRRADDVRVLGHDPVAGTVTLSADADTRLPGRYSFWFDHGRGHARLGVVLDEERRRVVRRVEAVDDGDLAAARSGRIGGWLWRSPRDAGLAVDDVAVDTPLGPAPAWLVPGPSGTDGRWMIGVHGRGVTRAETVRAAPVFHREGVTSLLVSYRNDTEAPPSPDGRYALGDDEWSDVEAAMRWAVDHGATSIVLMGWSMGGATVLQALTRAAHRQLVVGVVLESPVVDWRTTLRYQGTAMRVPRVVQELAMRLLQSPRASRLSGRAGPVDLDRLDLVEGAGQLHVPVLVLHSDDDGFVPSTASRALAEARPDIVQLESFAVARHTKIWNYDPERFEAVIADWLGRLPPASGRRARSGRPSSAG